MEIRKNFFINVFIFSLILTIPNVEAKKVDFKPSDSIKSFCLGKNTENDNSKIEKIEIKVNKNKIWAKNLLNLHVNFQREKSQSQHNNWFPNFRISDKFKKKYKSKVYINYSNSTKCVFNSYVRITGDLWWHLGWNKGTPITSLNVELIDGHVENITRFKMLLPASRYGSNEIFTSTLLKKLNFLSPRTFFVKGKINGFTSDYIFQEDLRKEFLENSGLKEGPILEGDERFTVSLKDNEHFYDKKTNLSKLANKAYAKKNFSNLHTSLRAVSQLNELYILNHNANYPEKFNKNINLYLFSDYFFKDKKIRENLEIYESLIYAIDAAHSLSFDDRRFYYDAINASFLPIYYDGKSNILEKEQITKNSDLNSSVSLEAKKGSELALKQIKSINKKDLLKDLNYAGVTIDAHQLTKVINKIITRLEIIKTSDPQNISTSLIPSYFSLFKKEETRNKKLIFTKIATNEFKICDFKYDQCQIIKFQPEKFNDYLADFLNQDFKNFQKEFNITNELIFLHSNLNFENKKYKLANQFSKWKNIMVENSFFQFNEHIQVDVDKLNKLISINQKNKKGIALFKGGNLNNWKIEFNGYEFKKDFNNDLINQFNLTGCLNLYNLNLNKVSFNIKNSSCEDAINLVNTNGNIDEIFVENSISDAVDMDFSNLNIKKILIDNSFNDCLDLSYGNYNINNLIVNKCGDKGLSVGEKSKLKVDNFFSKNTMMAVASKDSSIVNLDSTQIQNTKICFAAYRKKQEFSGGKIYINSSNCKKDNIYFSKGSEIVFLK